MRSPLASPVTPAFSAGPGQRAALIAVTTGALLVGAALPAALALPAGSPSAVHVRGTVERIHLDDFGHPERAGNDELTFVRAGDGLVQVPASDLAAVPTGASVDLALVTGSGLGRTSAGSLTTSFTGAAAHDPEAGVDVASVRVAAIPPGTVATGTGLAPAHVAVAAGVAAHSVLVVMARPGGAPAPSVTAASVVATIKGAVNGYWDTVTRGAVTFTATAYPTVVTTTSVPCTLSGGSVSIGSTGSFWSEVATKVGFSAASGQHLLVYFDPYAACGGIAGLASLGSSIASGGRVWINGYNELDVIGHELGHNLSLGHSQVLDCATSGVRVTDTTDPASCQAREYADTNDIMGIAWGNAGYLNASHLRHLGLLTATDQRSPTSGMGTVTLTPLETPGALRVLTLTSGATHYVVEFRRPVGLDSWLAGDPLWGSSGVTVRKEFDLSAASAAARYDDSESYLLDGNPVTPDSGFGSLATTLSTGAWVELAGSQLAVRITGITPTSATVDYRVGLPSTDPHYTPPPRPIVSAPVSSLAVGGVTPGASSVVVPLRWRFTVTTPAVAPATRATVVAKSAATSGRAGVASALTAAYTATAAAADGTLVRTRAATGVRYLGESTVALAPTYSRGWVGGAVGGAMGSRARLTAAKGMAVSFRATGRSIGLLLAHGPAYGTVAIYVDGKYAGAVSLRASRSGVGMAWTRSFASSGRHLVRLVNYTGGARGHVGFDGVVTLS